MTLKRVELGLRCGSVLFCPGQFVQQIGLLQQRFDDILLRRFSYPVKIVRSEARLTDQLKKLLLSLTALIGHKEIRVGTFDLGDDIDFLGSQFFLRHFYVSRCALSLESKFPDTTQFLT